MGAGAHQPLRQHGRRPLRRLLQRLESVGDSLKIDFPFIFSPLPNNSLPKNILSRPPFRQAPSLTIRAPSITRCVLRKGSA